MTVTTDQELSGTLACLLARHAADPGRIFAVAEDEQGHATVISYAEQLRRAQATAGALAELGVRPGDRVHLHTANCPEFFDVWFATALLGAVLLPTGPQSSADELSYVLQQTAPVVSLTARSLRATVSAAISVAESESNWRGARQVALHGSEPDALPALAAEAAPVPIPQACGAGPDTRTAAILYTSGTTSRPKGVLVTHANYRAVGAAIAGHLAITEQDRWLIALPLFHANAQYYCTMSALTTGASIVLAPRFSASGWARQAADYGATLGSLFAAPIRMILAQPPAEAEQRSRLRAVLFAQNLSDSQTAEFERRFAARLLQLYGMTETVLPPTINPDTAERRWHSIGRPLPGVRLRLARADGTTPGPGEPGELLVAGVSGVTLAAGYYRDPMATAATFRDGWLYTGDLARLADDGYFHFVDRAKDMIKRSGENVSAGEIERVAAEHPAIAECAAIGVPDPLRDEAIVLVVVAAPDTCPDPAELIAWCADQLAPYKVPSSVVFTDALPRTSVGKIAKARLRSRLVPDSLPPTPQTSPVEDA